MQFPVEVGTSYDKLNSISFMIFVVWSTVPFGSTHFKKKKHLPISQLKYQQFSGFNLKAALDPWQRIKRQKYKIGVTHLAQQI